MVPWCFIIKLIFCLFIYDFSIEFWKNSLNIPKRAIRRRKLFKKKKAMIYKTLQLYVFNFLTDLRQVGGFLRVLHQ